MKDTQGHRFVLGGAAAAFVLAACGSGTSTPSGATFASSPIAAYRSGVTKHPDYRHSWSHVKPSLTKLLYVSDDVTDDVYMYAYPSGTLVAAITGFVMPSGLCVRQPGLIFVTDTGASDIKEYKFGGTSPIQTISDAGEYPVSCSVDPTNGHLAVANYETTSSGPGSISVYPPPYSTLTVYADPTMQNFYFIGYRPNGRKFLPMGSIHLAHFSSISYTRQSFRRSRWRRQLRRLATFSGRERTSSSGIRRVTCSTAIRSRA